MSQYFLAGNLWLIFAVLALVGRKTARTTPDMYSFFGVGQWLYPQEYTTFLVTLIAMAAGCFLLHWRSCRCAARQKVSE